MDEKIILPKRIEESIGYCAWTALSWALHNGWVKDYKWYFSEIDERDFGTPLTVGKMLILCDLMKITDSFYTLSEEPERAEFEKVGTRGLFMLADRIEQQQVPEFYGLLIEGYLLGTDFVSPTKAIPDEHGANQLEGELKRYWAQKQSIQNPSEIQITKEILNDYCTTYDLIDRVKIFAEQLKL